MENRPIFAILYDFDKTLSTKNMQDYGFIPAVGQKEEAFWAECNRFAKEHHMDQILAYMYYMQDAAKGKLLINRQTFQDLGKKIHFFPGVKDWFGRANQYAAKKGLICEHYIVSSGLKEFIEGTEIASHFHRIYAAEFHYDDKNVPVWPAMAINYTSKTQFLFRVNKGILNVTEHDGLNEFTPDDERPVPFKNMLYIGDGPTDVPCMKLCKANGGHSMAVYQDSRDKADQMLLDGRIDFAVPADYRKGSRLEEAVFAVIDKVAAQEKTKALHKADLHEAKTGQLIKKGWFNPAFWASIDELVAKSNIVIDRPRGTAHPTGGFTYPMDYGFLAGTSSADGAEIDVWHGSKEQAFCDAVLCTVDLEKRDSEIKLLLGCTEEEKEDIVDLQNRYPSMQCVLVARE